MTKTIAVIGATGTQGSSVVRTLLDSPQSRDTWSIRAITRSKNGEVAENLRAEGVEVVQADLDNLASLRDAFSGCNAVFAVTDFFVPFANNGANAAEAMELEWRRATNIADAVSATASVEHFVWSTLPHAGRITGGKVQPAHFVAKNRLDDRIKSDPNLLRRTTFLWVGWYATNFLYPMFAPTQFESAGKHIQLGPVDPDIPIASIGDPRKNIGPFVQAILEKPAQTRDGKFVLAVTEMGSMNKFLEAWSEVTGKPSQFVRCSLEDYEQLWPGWGTVEGQMQVFYNDFGDQVDGSEDNILTAADLGVPIQKATSVVEAVRTALAGGV